MIDEKTLKDLRETRSKIEDLSQDLDGLYLRTKKILVLCDIIEDKINQLLGE